MRLRFIGQRYSKSIIAPGYIILSFLCLCSICFAEEGEWTRKADMPVARGFHSASVVYGKIYVIGGAIGGGGSTMYSTVYEYDPATDIWTKKTDMPTPRGFFATSVVNDKIYAIGGWDGSRDVAEVEEYDVVTDEWIARSGNLRLTAGLATSAVDGRIYAIGGCCEELLFTAGLEYQTDLDNLEVSEGLRQELEDNGILLSPNASVSISVKGRAWRVTDRDKGNLYFVEKTGDKLYVYIEGAAVDEYDPKTDRWVEKPSMPTPRSDLTSSAVNRRIYAIGGVITEWACWGSDQFIGLPAVEEYDPATDIWTKKADMPTPRGLLSSCVLNGKIYAIGGWLLYNPRRTVEIYDPVTDTWTKGSDMPTARDGLSASVVNGHIYAIGGWNGSNRLLTVEEYDTGTGIPWIQVIEAPPREGSVHGGDSIAIFGEGLTSVVSVTIGGNPMTQMEVTDTLITGVTPPGIEGEWAIVLLTPRSDYSVFAGKFIYRTPSDVVLERITPTNGKLAGGDKASISGSGFLPGATVTIGGVPATSVGITPILISFTIPPGSEGTKDVVVTNLDGQKAMLRGGYTYNPFPVIKRVMPGAGGPLSGGAEMTITGSNFMEGVTVTIGESQVEQLVLFSPTELRLRTPPGTVGSKSVRVRNPDGQEAVEEDGFSYNLPPSIISVSPNAGPLEGGTRITITGTGFIRPVDVLIGGAEASSVETVLPAKITALTPLSDAGIKDVVARNPDGQRDTLKNAFTYNTAPVITRVTPDNGRLAGGTRITIHGGGFQPGAEVRISINQGAYRAASSVEVMSSSIITALTPPGQPGAENVLVLNPDMQIAIRSEGYTYNPIPTITRLIPNHGPSSGGTTITIEGTGFLLGARVVIGERPATTMVRDDMTIEAVAPPNPQGVWDVKVINPDTQEVIKPRGYVSVGELVYNYPNPFRASQGTTFRYVTKDPVLSVTVKIFNMRGRPIGAARQTGSNEVKWVDPDVYAGLYVYILEAELEGGKKRQVKNVMEVLE